MTKFHINRTYFFLKTSRVPLLITGVTLVTVSYRPSPQTLRMVTGRFAVHNSQLKAWVLRGSVLM